MAKAVKKQALGRGLSALLKDPENDIKSASDKNADKLLGNIVELRIGLHRGESCFSHEPTLMKKLLPSLLLQSEN